jgi:hypothetical protein
MEDRRNIPRYPFPVPVEDDLDGDGWDRWMADVAALTIMLGERAESAAEDGDIRRAVAIGHLLDRWERRTAWFVGLREDFVREFNNLDPALAPTAVLASEVGNLRAQLGALQQLVDQLMVTVDVLTASES